MTRQPTVVRLTMTPPSDHRLAAMARLLVRARSGIHGVSDEGREWFRGLCLATRHLPRAAVERIGQLIEEFEREGSEATQ